MEGGGGGLFGGNIPGPNGDGGARGGGIGKNALRIADIMDGGCGCGFLLGITTYGVGRA